MAHSNIAVLVVVFLILFAAQAESKQPTPFYLVKNGKPLVDIVVPVEATPVELYAAKELSETIEKMSGVRLAVQREESVTGKHIYIGRTHASAQWLTDKQLGQLGDDGYRTMVREGNLYIVGGRKRGALYGVYEYLESLGVRWYTPDYTVMPHLKDIAMPAKDVSYVPKLWYRDQWWNNRPSNEWLARMRINGSNGQNHSLPDSMGGSISSTYSCHSFGDLVPPSQNFDKHPEWFALKPDGKRSPTELCLTNRDLRLFMVQRILSDLKARDGKIENYWVSQNDGSLDACFCPICTAEREKHGGKDRWSANNVAFLNEVAREVGKDYPRVHLKMLAYSYTQSAPEGLTLPDNALVEICGNFGVWDTKHADLVKSWSKVASNLSVYTYGGSNYGYWWPFPNAVEVGLQCPLALKSGVKAFYIQGTALGYGSALVDLKAYLSARMAWNPSRDVNREVRDFCMGFYGPGARYVLEYLDWFWKDIHQRKVVLEGGWGDAERWRQWTTREAMIKSDTLFQKALFACKDQPVYLKHVRRAYLEVLWGRVMIDLLPGSDIRDREYRFAPGSDKELVFDRARLFGEIMRETGYNMASECDPFDAKAYPR